MNKKNQKSLIFNHQSIPPKQYKQGWTEFYKLKFYLTPDVLIPRPETELLVDEALKIIQNPEFKVRNPITVIDVGTGSGCIAISIAKNASNVKIFASDISEEALAVARENAKLHYSNDRVIIVAGDLLEKFRKAPDIIVANLPYIPTARLMLIDPMVTDFEPKIALDGGYDGFELYRKLFTQMNEHKIYPKYLIAEIDYSFNDLIESELPKYFPNAEFEIKLDLTKKQRILVIRFID